jgi:hypothetical protein
MCFTQIETNGKSRGCSYGHLYSGPAGDHDGGHTAELLTPRAPSSRSKSHKEFTLDTKDILPWDAALALVVMEFYAI